MFKLVLRKMLKNKWLVLCLIIGCMLAVSVISAIPIYADGILQRLLIKDLEHRQEVTSAYPVYTKYEGMFSNVTSREWRENLYTLYDYKIKKDMADDIPMDILFSFQSISAEDKIYVDVRDWPAYLQEIKDEIRFKDTLVGQLNAYGIKNFDKIVNLVSGEFYKPGKIAVENEYFTGEVYEVVITTKAMQRSNYTVGGIYTMCFNDKEEEYILNYRITGVIEEMPENQSFFALDTFGIYFDFDTFYNSVLNERHMSISSCVWYHAYDYYDLKMIDISTVIDSLDSNHDWIELNHGRLLQIVSFETELVNYLERSEKLARLMLFLIMPVVIMIGLYVTMITQLVMEKEKNEIALLESRGAGRLQIFAIYLWESLTIGIVSYILGLGGAYLLTKVLGASSGFMEFINRSALQTNIGREAVFYGGLCILVFIVMMLIPAFVASKYTIVQFKQGKGVFTKKPFWQKLYLDFALLAATVYTMLNYSKFQDSVSYVGEVNVDYLIFFVVTFFILGVSLVFMRIYPLIINLVFRAGHRLWSPSVYSALAYVARGGNMRQFIMIFLILALGVGIFSANSVRTINKNIEDEIRYTAGADTVLSIARIGYPDLEDGWTIDSMATIVDNLKPSEKREKFTGLQISEGIDTITKVVTLKTDVMSEGYKAARQKNVTLMAITPEQFGEVAWYRPDLYDYHINHYLNLMAAYPEGVILSKKLAEKIKAEPGEMIHLIMNNLEIECLFLAAVDYWPGYNRYKDFDENGAGKVQELCIMHFKKLQAAVGDAPFIAWIKKDEGFMDSELNDVIRAQEITLFDSIYTDFNVSEAKKDPMLQGMNGILTLSFVVTMIICGAGFIIFWILSIRQRILQFGILRAMGLKKREIISSIIWEQVLLSGVAVIMGILIGGITSELFIPLFHIMEEAHERIIPFIMVSDRRDYYIIYSIIGIILAAGTASIGRFIVKIKMDQAVKLGED